MSWFRGFIAKSGSALLYRKMAEKEAGAPATAGIKARPLRTRAGANSHHHRLSTRDPAKHPQPRLLPSRGYFFSRLFGAEQ
jgi:hypothetical protein